MLEHVGGDDVVELAADLVRQALVEVRLDELVEAFADAFVLDDVDSGDLVAEGPGERAELAVGTADVEQAPGRSLGRAISAARRATSAARA